METTETRSSSLHDETDLEMEALDQSEQQTNNPDETQFMIGTGSMMSAVESRDLGGWTTRSMTILFSMFGLIAAVIICVYHSASVVHSKVGELHPALHEEPELDGTLDAHGPSTSSLLSLTDKTTFFPFQGPIQASDVNEVQSKGSIFNSSDVKELQISNYIEGSALILNIHITHHAGTSVCNAMRKMGPTPSFACMSQVSGDETSWPENDPNINRFSMTYADAETLVDVFRPYFHFMSIEYSRWGNLHNANWEYENLVSIIVMRNPLDRFLAFGKCGQSHFTAINEADNDPESEEMQQLYWEYANDACADNFALRVLAGKKKCDETNMDECFESAKALLKRFTFILDEDCLDESMEAVGAVLNLDITSESFANRLHREHTNARDRIGNDTLYEFLLDKFHYDIELYEWSKTVSVVQCNKLANLPQAVSP